MCNWSKVSYLLYTFVYYCTTNINLSLIFGTLYLWPFRQHFPHNIIIVGLNLEYPSTSHFVFFMWYDYTQSYESAIIIISSVTYLPLTLYHYIPEITKQKCCVSGRDVPDIGFNSDSNLLDTRYTGYQIVASLYNVQLKCKRNTYVFPLI